VNLGGNPPVHLTYCTNIHPGETWSDVRRNLECHVEAVRRELGRSGDFGIGLRLSGRASAELGLGAELDRLRSWLSTRGFYVFTINGFPHGRFHGTRVKENVYRPDWLEDERVAYTDLLAEQLARLLPDDEAVTGSVSTVPGAFRARLTSPADIRSMALRMVRHAAKLHALEKESGRTVTLAVEPEPACHMETISETVDFLRDHVVSAEALTLLAQTTGMTRSQSERFLREHVGICLDTCHAAVEFENQAQCLAQIAESGFEVFKMQLSAGLCIDALDAERAAELERWDDDVYLHQVVSLENDRLERFVDIPEALAKYRSVAHARPDWRVHFHVPIFRRELGPFVNTQDFLSEILATQRKNPFTTHLEVETYTWDVLPSEYRGANVDVDVARELSWVLERLER